ncbi:CHAT domain-containing protein [Mycena sp. CBHHK59/15]|nr:CHAT domain-containing protein [Mycena sp. CBHHK59/15]
MLSKPWPVGLSPWMCVHFPAIELAFHYNITQEFELTAEDDPRDIMTLASNILTDFHRTVDLDTLDTALSLRTAYLADALLTRFQLDESVHLLRRVYQLRPNRALHFCASLLARIQSPREMAEPSQLWLQLPELSKTAVELGEAGTDFLNIFVQSKDLQYLDKAVETLRSAESQILWGHPKRGFIANNLALALSYRFQWQSGAVGDLDSAIELYPARDPDRCPSMTNLAIDLHRRFRKTGDATDLDSSIELHSPHPDHIFSLTHLATVLHERFKNRGSTADLDRSIELRHEALTLRPDPSTMNHLAKGLQEKFQLRGDMADLDNAIELHRRAIALCPTLPADRCSFTSDLAVALQQRFDHSGDAVDLDSAIELHYQARALCPDAFLDADSLLSNLGIALRQRFSQRRDMADLDSAIQLQREALVLQPDPHPGYSASRNQLALALRERFEHGGDLADLDDAIALHREAADGVPGTHPSRRAYLGNLGNVLHARFKKRGDPADLDSAIEQHREALTLGQDPAFITNLALVLRERFQQRGNASDIESAIELHRTALSLQPENSDYLTNLANVLRQRFQQIGDTADIDSAIELHRRALAQRPAPHPGRGTSLHNLAVAVHNRLEQTVTPTLRIQLAPHSDASETFPWFMEASAYLPSPLSRRFTTACAWAYYAGQWNHESALEAYESAISLRSQLTLVSPDIRSRQKALSSNPTYGLAGDSAACAVRLNNIERAVEFAEAGPPLDGLRLADPDLAQQVSDILQELEHRSHQDLSLSRMALTAHSKEHVTLDAEAKRYRQLNVDWLHALNDVRNLPGFEDFLLPKRLEVLRGAAINGPVVILNSSNYSCVALIVTRSDDIQCVSLPDVTVAWAIFLVQLLRALSRSTFNLHDFLQTRQDRNAHQNHTVSEARLIGQLEGSDNTTGPDGRFKFVLSELWTSIVKPVFDSLKLKKSPNPSRLWWCPTGPLTFLPIHAAGLYGEFGADCVADYVVSSYSPTLTALLHPPTDTRTPFKMTALIQPETPGQSSLPGAEEELVEIEKRVPERWLTSLGKISKPTVETVLSHLRQSSIVHFACHGTQDVMNPLDSGLILTDERLKVSEIMRRPDGSGRADTDLPGKHMSLAFLSACETAKGSDDLPDEAMHLAGTLLFAGFRGVVATMWAMDDRDGPRIAGTFYEHLFRNCDAGSDRPVLPNLSDAAYALHLAVAKLREDPDVSFSRWVPFVHYGV